MNRFFSLATLLEILFFFNLGLYAAKTETEFPLNLVDEVSPARKPLGEMTADEFWDSFTEEDIAQIKEYEYRQEKLHPESCVTDFEIVTALAHFN
ncbi:MAG TPA: hypothetical protein VHA52_07915, partial [Candidatus Babeliaceae bacterium]|nr:hypothetical protein [Candidatus Babeliaceae bacterium]